MGESWGSGGRIYEGLCGMENEDRNGGWVGCCVGLRLMVEGGGGGNVGSVGG